MCNIEISPVSCNNILEPLSKVCLFSTTEDTYTFSDGTVLTYSGDFVTGVTWNSTQFTSWNTNQPSSTDTTRENQDCVKVRSDGMWDDISCAQEKNYACQKDTAVIEPSPTCADGWSQSGDLCFKLEEELVDYFSAKVRENTETWISTGHNLELVVHADCTSRF